MSKAALRHRFAAQRGGAAVEFALLAIILFVFIFGTIEIARMFYVWSTMTQVTARAARSVAMANKADAPATLSHAMFLDAPGGQLPLAGDIGTAHLRVEYLKFDAETPVTPSAVQACLALNTVKCLDDPHGDSCVRFVRVRLCKPGSAPCAPVAYQPLVTLPAIDKLGINMPLFTAIAPVGTMGTPGACP
jgi:hypothetical protein